MPDSMQEANPEPVQGESRTGPYTPISVQTLQIRYNTCKSRPPITLSAWTSETRMAPRSPTALPPGAHHPPRGSQLSPQCNFEADRRHGDRIAGWVAGPDSPWTRSGPPSTVAYIDCCYLHTDMCERDALIPRTLASRMCCPHAHRPIEDRDLLHAACACTRSLVMHAMTCCRLRADRGAACATTQVPLVRVATDAVVVVTEVPGNPGRSVVNTISQIAIELRQRSLVPTSNARWSACFPGGFGGQSRATYIEASVGESGEVVVLTPELIQPLRDFLGCLGLGELLRGQVPER
jgi:hypothetical protein